MKEQTCFHGKKLALERAMMLFAFLQERQKNPIHPVNPI
jgi:hypothetical protein